MLATLGICLALLAGLLVASGSSSAADDRSPSGIALLDRGQSASDASGLPPDAEELATLSPGKDASFADARKATLQGTWNVWATIGTSDVCIAGDRVSTGVRMPYAFACASVEHLANDGILTAVENGPEDINGMVANETVVFGIVPDGAHSAHWRFADGSTQPVAIVDSSIAADSTANPQSLVFLDRENATHEFNFTSEVER